MKANTLLAVCVLMFSTLAQGASITLNTGTEGTVVLQTSPVEVKSDGAGTVVFSCDDVFWLSDTGEPRIPWKVITVLLPPDADLSSLTCRIERPVLESIAGSWQVEPMPPIATRDENGQEIVLWPEDKRIIDGRDADIYEHDAFWPQEQLRLSGTGKLRKWKLAEVAIPLVRYNPVSGRLLRLTEAEITVDIQSKVRSLDTNRPDPLGRSRVQSMAANFAEAVAAYDTAAWDGKGNQNGGEEGIASPDPCSTGYVIITTSAIQSASTKLSAFVTHKQSLGFTVQVITESTWRVSTGDTDANNIRAWLAGNYVISDILYVLLIGNPHPGTGDVPMKMCISDHPTDYFYAELTADWDKDGDGIYGESGSSATAGNEVEKYFEVYTGRIPYYGNIADTDAILQKIIDYETATDVDWRRNVLLPMVPLDDKTPSYQLGEQIKNNLLEPEAIASDRIYDKTYGVIPPPEYLRSEAYPATVWSQNKYGLNVWMTHGSSGSASGIINTGNVPNLDDSYPSATYQGSCTNCRPESTNNLCYALLKNGAIATVGATRLSWYYIGQTNFTNTSSIGGLGYQYAKRLVERQSCGQAIYNTKEALSFWLKNYYVMMLYGDPSVVIFGPSPDFTVSPTDMFYQVGPYKGPFSSMSRSYILKNNSSSPVDWTAATTADWLNIPAGGTIGPTGSVTIDALSGTEVYDLPVGRYCGELILTDTALGKDYSRQAALEIKPRSMVAHWKLDETSGTTASDSSGSGYHGTLEGGFSFDTASVGGKFGGALDFSHPNDRVDTGKTALDFELANNAAKSITAWVFTRSFNDGGIYEMGRHSNGQDFSLRTESTDNWWRAQYWGSSYDIDFSYDSKNKWVHFAHVYDGTRARIYANGQLVVDEPRALNTTDRKTFKIGRWDDHHFDGVIDDVRIYNYPLDIDEILAISGGGCAENPHPFDSEIDTPYCATLSWVPGAKAYNQDVYFGTNRDAVANATTASSQYKGRQTDTFYIPTMNKSTQYFWRVDQVTSGPGPGAPPSSPPSSAQMAADSTEESDSSWQDAEAASAAGIITGNVWSFTTGVGMGTITREVWTDIGGNNYVTDLTGHPLFPDSPNIREEITSFEGPIDWAHNYGTRIHGFLTPSETGSYTFWIASDDYSELWLSSNSDPANQIKIAEVIGHTNPRQWGKYSGQQSSPVTLTAGQAYYIKALHKEGGGGDNIAVAWQIDGSCKGRQVISGSYLFPYDTDFPTPDPMTWATQPHPTSSTSVSMTATAASDRSGVEYYFTCTLGGGHDSGWQDSTTYIDTDLTPNTLYTYTVTARDKNPNHNTTASSQPSSARTTLFGDCEPDGDVDFYDYACFVSHWPSATSGSEADFDDDNDVDMRDLAILFGNWLKVAEQPPPLPGQAGNPDPPDGATGIETTAVLSWTPDAYATSHDVYFGSSTPLDFHGNQTAAIFDPPGSMIYLRTYYWRIDEVNASGTTTGTVWSFTTRVSPGPGGPPP
ncbi:MAG: LamG-like jellyroll fold domain-containing protein [Planctomycetota bacterium]